MIRILVLLLICCCSDPVVAQDGDASEERFDDPSNVREQQPKFPGGDEAMMKFIKKELEYPGFAKVFNIEGEAHVSFIIEENGEVTSGEVLNDVNWSLKKEAIRVVEKMPRWEPGRQDGEAVPVQVKVPIRFQLDG